MKQEFVRLLVRGSKILMCLAMQIDMDTARAATLEETGVKSVIDPYQKKAYVWSAN